jgi:hypothetical protein
MSLISVLYQSCATGKATGKAGKSSKGKGSSSSSSDDDSCKSKSGKKGSDGAGGTGSCKSEPSVDARIYDITISATDKAGNKGETTCSIIVIPEDHYETEAACTDPSALQAVKKDSKQRFKLSQSSSTWANEKISEAVPPSPEQVEESFGDGCGEFFIPDICQEKTSKGKSGKRGKADRRAGREMRISSVGDLYL